MKKIVKALLLLLLIFSSAQAQVVSRFDFDDPAFDEKIATIGPNAISSGTLANARATGNGTPQGCAAGSNSFGVGGCGNFAGCQQNINMVVPNTGNIFNVNSPTMSIDYRRPVREVDGWFWLKDQLAFGVRFSKLTARYSYDNGLGGCVPQIEFAAYPPAWNWPVNGLWTFGGAAPSNGELPVDGVWRTVGFTYDQATGVASITVSNPAHTEYNFAVAGMAFCGWTAANMSMFPTMDNGATGVINNTAFLDNARYGNVTVLPVVLEYFRGDQDGLGVNLNWKTTSEQQNMGFILYRSTDAENWIEMTRVDGHNTTGEENTYSYRDNSPYRGINFYRLVQVDMNGATAGFPAVKVNVQYDGSDILALFPNPVTEGQLHLTFDSESEDSPLSVQILNMAGQVMSVQDFRLHSGVNQVDMDMSMLASGLYIAKVSDGKGTYSQKFSVVSGNR
ncbi:MAG: T9SS type A sorting domain-containing protein [Bacteroidia bacterium]